MAGEAHPLRFGLVLGQRATWPDLADRAREAEELGFDVLHVVDHFYGLRDVMDPTHEAWTILGGFALVTSRIRLGVMVCGNTYRNPAFLLKQAVTVDQMSNGRVDFGVGTGWAVREHEAYGWELPSPAVLVERFAEALAIWELLQREERTTYDGRHYQILDAPFEPKPVNGRLPLLIGASGPKMLRLTALYADIWNARGGPEEAGAGNRLLNTLCAEEGRDPAAIVRGVSPRLNFLTSVAAFEEHVAAYRAEGITDFEIPWPRTPEELPVLRQAAREVIPRLR